MWTLDKHAKLSVKVQQDLMERSRQGIWAHPLCMVLGAVTTGLMHRAPLFMSLAIGAAMVQGLWRRELLRRLEGSGGGKERRQRSVERMHLWLLLSCAALWGLVAGGALYRFGCQDREVLTLLLYHAVVAFATINLLVHDRGLIRAALVLLFGPLLVGHLMSGSAHPLNYMSAAVVYFLYCLAQGKKLNGLYEHQVSDNYELSIAAYRDCLTGLPNRLYMNKMLDSCVDEASEGRRQIAMLYIDLDGFKQINDRHSHKVGDLFLCEAATRISNCLGKGEVAARIGGDEFTILLPYASEEQAIGLAHRIMSAAREPMVIDGRQLSYSTSIGVSLFPQMASTAELLVRSADEAMYAAKMSGKDRVCLASSGASSLRLEKDDEMRAFRSIGGMAPTLLASQAFAC